MRFISALINISRIHNCILTSVAVTLGFWFSSSSSANNWKQLVLLVLAALSATAYGNIINDIKDVKTDRINRPSRPLVRGDISSHTAFIFASVCALLSLFCSVLVSWHHFLSVVMILVMLSLYTLFLKNTPLLGNLFVSLLVGYSIIFGGLGNIYLDRVIVPAILAFFLNLSREIIKDIQDEYGDRKTCYTTSAILPEFVLKTLITFCSVASIVLIILPFLLGHFGYYYIGLCYLSIVPLEVVKIKYLFSPHWKQKSSTISLLIKIELSCGLISMALDRVIT